MVGTLRMMRRGWAWESRSRGGSQGKGSRAGAAERTVDASMTLLGGERSTSHSVVLLTSLSAEALEHGCLRETDEVHVDCLSLLQKSIMRDVRPLSSLLEVSLVQWLVQDSRWSLGRLPSEGLVDSGPAEESVGVGRFTIVVSLGSTCIRTEGLVTVPAFLIQEKTSTLGSLSMSVLTKQACQGRRGSGR